ncbi:hypothetical protein E2562_010242 [Oryza meyeriana var. granulata]|uniref:Uncharacterized protein n=1 Tax=Oryza meyeriana var. granulata TaxID=110450 RepID=A0A6G1EHU6_9ORYZ|nr:hypothetical protein E2562_010242 [Oryza meyeriana var. granulata]
MLLRLPGHRSAPPGHLPTLPCLPGHRSALTNHLLSFRSLLGHRDASLAQLGQAFRRLLARRSLPPWHLLLTSQHFAVPRSPCRAPPQSPSVVWDWEECGWEIAGLGIDGAGGIGDICAGAG